MKAKEFFCDVAQPNINDMRASGEKSYRHVWNAVTSLNHVCDYAALEALKYPPNWSQDQIDAEVKRLRASAPGLPDLALIANAMKHVRSHRRVERLAGYIFSATASAVATDKLDIRHGDGTRDGFKEVLMKVEAAEAYWKKQFGL